MSVIDVQHLCKVYPGKVAVDDISFSLNEGEIFGLLGPNGSGKTTTILMVLGLLEPTAGSVTVLGKSPLRSPLEVKRLVGYLPDTVGFYDNLTLFENLDYTASFLGLDAEEREKRINEAFAVMHLGDRAHMKVKTLSHGLKQRLGLAKALIADPDILILDEPTNGLDPKGIVELREFILELKNKGKTIILCSHILSEMEQLASNITFINKGKQIKSITSEELSTEFGKKIEIVTNETEKISNFLRERFSEASVKQENNSVLLSAVNIQFMELFDLFKKNNISVNGITEKNISLEDYFMEIVK